MTSQIVTVNGVLKERENASRLPGVYVTVEELVGLAGTHCQLDLRAQRRALAAMAGSHRSAFRGRGIDFDEVRMYNPGDDVRTIDWRVTARTGRVHTKVFREERERPVYLMVDQRQSMFFGSRTALKSVVAARAAALIAWAAKEHGDRLGAFLFNDTHSHEVRPKEGKRGIQGFFRALVQFNQWLGPETPVAKPSRQAISQAVEGLAQVVRPGSLVFLISDFHHFDDICLQQLSLVKRHSDIIALSICDPLEKHLPPSGAYGFTDGQRSLQADTSSKQFRKQFAMQFLEHQAQTRQRLSSLAIPMIEVSTENDLAESLNQALGFRTGRGLRRP